MNRREIQALIKLAVAPIGRVMSHFRDPAAGSIPLEALENFLRANGAKPATLGEVGNLLRAQTPRPNVGIPSEISRRLMLGRQAAGMV